MDCRNAAQQLSLASLSTVSVKIVARTQTHSQVKMSLNFNHFLFTGCLDGAAVRVPDF